ncbi:SIR2 family protein [Serratia marcescens]|uniref:SIR2 family protein n=1 Tax=Serratia marcescens TaxID=615 RepID=UPI00301DA564
MTLDDVIGRISSTEVNYYQSLEVFLFNLLKNSIDNDGSGRKMLKLKGGDIGDSFCPLGVEYIKGGTIITFRFFSSRANIDGVLDDVNLLIKLSGGIKNVKNLLLISINPMGGEDKQNLAKTLRRVYGLDFFFWDKEEINDLIEKNSNYSSDLLDNLFKARVKAIVNGKRIDWLSQRQKIVDELKDCYRQGQFSLFLGAGVSSSAGMPDWNTLLNSLFVSYLSIDLDVKNKIDDGNVFKFVKRFNEINDSSALMAARYLRKGMSSIPSESKGFVASISKNLYELRNKDFSEESELIKIISSLCIPKRTGAAIRSIVTYNFDDLIEKQLTRNSVNYRCIYNGHDTYAPYELPIYHVHGFLPEKKEDYEDIDSTDLIFSEEGYHQLYSDPYHWSNLVQLSCLRENNCLLIGLSMNDPNLRRLLEISMLHSGQSKHYAFMKRISLDFFCYDKIDGECRQIIDDKKSASEYLEQHHDLSFALLQELGVKTIWYEEYDEIPKILEELYQQKF